MAPFVKSINVLLEIHNFYGYAGLLFANSVTATNHILRLIVFLFPLYLILKIMDEETTIQKLNLGDYIHTDFQTYLFAYLILILVYILFSIYLYKNRKTILNPVVAEEIRHRNIVKLKDKPAREIIWTAIAFESDLLLFIFLAVAQVLFMPEMIIVNVVFFIFYTLISSFLVGRFNVDHEATDLAGLIVYVLILSVFAFIAVKNDISSTVVVIIFFMQRLMVMSMIRVEKNSIKLNSLF